MFSIRRTSSIRPNRRLIPFVLTAVCALTIAACGSTSAGHRRTAASTGAFLAFSECMRSHGITNFPDPSGRGGINLDGTNLNPFTPSFKSAQAACRKLMPGGGPPAHASEQQKEQLVATAACMRTHGVTGFPDPTTMQPTSLQEIQDNYSIAEGIGGDLFLLVPKTIDVNSPAFKHAANACQFH